MLRNYKHSHLVEFIGTAMAVERGADTVREQPTMATVQARFCVAVLLCSKGGSKYLYGVMTIQEA